MKKENFKNLISIIYNNSNLKIILSSFFIYLNIIKKCFNKYRKDNIIVLATK